jgi:hypothetical protein
MSMWSLADNDDWRRFSSRRFLIVLLYYGASTLALFTNHMGDTAYVSLGVAAIGLFKLSEFYERKAKLSSQELTDVDKHS